MSKALDILNSLDNLLFSQEIRGVDKISVNFEISFRKNVQEAIAELEALQQPKSCDDCRSKSCSIKRILLELGEINSSYFYCNDYEPKEQ